MEQRVWRVGRTASLALDRARVLAILNVTPDSFSDGGRLTTAEAVVEAARRAVAEGADGLDIGGESTRPGAASVGEEEQIARVVPAVRAVRAAGLDCVITVDTTRAAVAAAAFDAGADGVNDVSGGLDDAAMLPLVAERGCGIVLMHRLRRPSEDRFSHAYDAPPEYGPEPWEGEDPGDAASGVVAAVARFLEERAGAALAAGVAREGIVLDPGLGFGKTVEQNFRLIAATAALARRLGFPLLGGASRKSFIGKASGVETPAERVAGSVAASVAQRLGGAAVFRVHDVRAQSEALRVTDRVRSTSNW